jgi:hypothetical protein
MDWIINRRFDIRAKGTTQATKLVRIITHCLIFVLASSDALNMRQLVFIYGTCRIFLLVHISCSYFYDEGYFYEKEMFENIFDSRLDI